MRALTITRYGPPEVLAVREVPGPRARPGQVCIRVARAGLNFADVSARVGLYPDAPKPPMVMGYEVSGDGGRARPGRERAAGRHAGAGDDSLRRAGDPRARRRALRASSPRGDGPGPGGGPARQLADRAPHAAPGGESPAGDDRCSSTWRQAAWGSPPSRSPGRWAGVDDLRNGVGLEARGAPGGRRAAPHRLPHPGLRGGGEAAHRGPRRATWCSTRSAGRSGRGAPRCSRPVGQLICFGWANATSGESRNLLKVAAVASRR